MLPVSKTLRKTFARRLRGARAVWHSATVSPRRLDPAFGAVCRRLLVGPAGFAPCETLAAVTKRRDPSGLVIAGPVPLDVALAPAEAPGEGAEAGPADEVAVDRAALAATPEAAADALLALLGRVRARLFVRDSGVGDLAALAAAVAARGSGQVATVRVLRRGWTGAPLALLVTRRRIGHLLLVAGPSASGKSALMAPLTRTARPGDAAGSQARAANEAAAEAVAGYLGLDRGPHWGRPAYAKRLSALADPVRSQLVLQYDFSRPLRHYWPLGQPDPVLDILDCAERVSAVTIWTPPPRLVSQAVQRARGRLPVSADKGPVGKAGLYANPEQVLSMYQCYFDSVEGRVDGHCVVEAGPELFVYSPEAWRDLVGAPACRIETARARAEIAVS